MKYKKFYLGFCYALIATSLIIFSACRKNKVAATEDIGYASDHATTEQTFTDVQTIADQASMVSSGSLNYRTTGSGCATVTRGTGTITIDFGSSDCLCHDGRLRRGKILITYTGNYADAGSVHTITFDNFYQNDNKITGTKTVTNMGSNAQGQPYFDITVSGAVTKAGGGTISANWQRVRTWTAGYNTPADPTDDVYQITGSGTMTRANGMLVNINITSPLTVACNCHWIEAGSVTYSLPGGLSRVLNYGDSSSCDDQATLTLANGTIRNITLP